MRGTFNKPAYAFVASVDKEGDMLGMMGMGCPVMGIFALVAATALLVWVGGKVGNPAQAVGKFLAWIAVITAVLLLAGQIFVCSKMCMSGKCGKMMGGMHQMMMDKETEPQGK